MKKLLVKGTVFSLCILILFNFILGEDKTKIGILVFKDLSFPKRYKTEKKVTKLIFQDVFNKEKFVVEYLNNSKIREVGPLLLRYDFVIKGTFESENNTLSISYQIIGKERKIILTENLKALPLSEIQREIQKKIDSLFIEVDIITYPIGASIYLNNKFIGNSPIKGLILIRGPYSIKAKLNGYEEYSEKVEFKEDISYEIILKSTGEPPIIVKECIIEVEPHPWTIVYIDGKRVGVSSDKIFKVEPGPHKVKLISPQYGIREIKVNIKRGQKIKIHFFKE